MKVKRNSGLGVSKLGAKKSESSGDKKMEEVLQDLEEKFGTKGSAGDYSLSKEFTGNAYRRESLLKREMAKIWSFLKGSKREEN